jgi:endonuclease/exonuclease/phosphatase family metal-dependent hydrolase
MMQGTVLRVLSYNIHKGLSLGNRAFILPEIRAALAALEPDIVFLQEVLGQHDKHADRFEGWPMSSQFEFLADGLWPHTAYGKNAVYSHGHHGNAILSKYPIVGFENLDVSTNAFESRGVLHAILNVPGAAAPVHCMCVHLNMLRRGREMQLKHLCRRVVRSVPNEEALIVAGDFNDWQEDASEMLFKGVGMHEVFLNLTGAHAPTFPSRFPVLRLDRIYARGVDPVGGEILCCSPWESLSDHAPLYAELLLPGKGGGTKGRSKMGVREPAQTP